MQEEWLQPGMTCLDPFGGTGLGGLDAGLAGIQWVGVELEPRFCALAHGFDCAGDLEKHDACPEQGQHGPHHVLGNLELWQRKYGHLPQWVAPSCLQGDSRRLTTVLHEQCACVVASPPWTESIGNDARVGHAATYSGQRLEGYGTALGQLAALPPGSLDAALDCAISSPPYAQSVHDGNGIDASKFVWKPAGIHSQAHAEGYGHEEGQLGAMTPGDIAAVVSSPPWENQLVNHDTPEKYQALKDKLARDGNGHGGTVGASQGQSYGNADGQLGQTAGDTFWSASKTILEQVFAVLKPGGHAIWVVKSYCREGKIVDFPAQWRALAEHVGFVTLHEHHAMLVETHSEMGLFGEPVVMARTARKSFFRRLYENAHPENAIDYEVVFCMQKAPSPVLLPPDDAWQQLPLIDGCVCSPPWLDQEPSHAQADTPSAQRLRAEPASVRGQRFFAATYGTTPGQLAALPAGSIDALIASPPFVSTDTKPTALGSGKGTRADGDSAGRNKGDYYYPASPGQLGTLPAGSVDTVVSSPPYAGTGEVLGTHNGIDYSKSLTGGKRRTPAREASGLTYGTSLGQLGVMPAGTSPTAKES